MKPDYKPEHCKLCSETLIGPTEENDHRYYCPAIGYNRNDVRRSAENLLDDSHYCVWWEPEDGLLGEVYRRDRFIVVISYGGWSNGQMKDKTEFIQEGIWNEKERNWSRSAEVLKTVYSVLSLADIVRYEQAWLLK